MRPQTVADHVCPVDVQPRRPGHEGQEVRRHRADHAGIGRGLGVGWAGPEEPVLWAEFNC